MRRLIDLVAVVRMFGHNLTECAVMDHGHEIDEPAHRLGFLNGTVER